MLRVVLLLPVVLAPSLMVAISLAERRFGPGMAGRLNALPLSIALAVLGVAADRGARAGAAVAESAAAHVPAQVAFALAFAAVLVRAGGGARDVAARGAARDSGLARGVAGGDVARASPARGGGAGGDVARARPALVAVGLATGAAAFAALSLVVSVLPAPLAIAAAVPALVVGRNVLASGERSVGERDGGAIELAARAAVALAFVLAVLAAVRASGPALGGAIAAFPALTATLALMIGRVRGPAAVAHLLGGVVRGLAGYLAFCVALAFTAPALGLAAAPLAAAACAGAYAASSRGVRLPATA